MATTSQKDTLEREVMRVNAAGTAAGDTGKNLLLGAMAVVTDSKYEVRQLPSKGGLASTGQDPAYSPNKPSRNTVNPSPRSPRNEEQLSELEIMKKNRGFHIDGEMFNKWRERVKEAEQNEKEAKGLVSGYVHQARLADQQINALQTHNAQLEREIELLKRRQDSCAGCAALREVVLQKDLDFQNLQKSLSKAEKKRSAAKKHSSTQTETVTVASPIMSPPRTLDIRSDMVDALKGEVQKLHDLVAEVRAKEDSHLVTINALKESLSMLNPDLEGKRDGTELVMMELNEIRQVLDDSPYGGVAWDHVMQCGLLSAACALKQRVIAQATESSKMKQRMSKMIEHQHSQAAINRDSGGVNAIKSQSAGGGIPGGRQRATSMLQSQRCKSSQAPQSSQFGEARRNSRKLLQKHSTVSATHR